MNELYKEELDKLDFTESNWEKFYGKTVLITGATGMIGSFLVDTFMEKNNVLQQKNQIQLILVSRDYEKCKKRFDKWSLCKQMQIMELDITESHDELLKHRIDYIIAGAGNADPQSFSSTPVDTMKSNFLGAYHALEVAKKNPGSRFIYLSTGEIYGNAGADAEDFMESDAYYIDSMNPRACYPLAKKAAETLCVSYWKQYEVQVVIGRLCYIYGPTASEFDSRCAAQFLRRAAAGKDIVLKSSGKQIRSYCYVSDAVCAILYLLIYGKGAEAYNICNAESNVSIISFAETLSQLANVKCIYDNPTSEETAGYSKVEKAVQNPYKINCLGWKAVVPLKEGLLRTILILENKE